MSNCMSTGNKPCTLCVTRKVLQVNSPCVTPCATGKLFTGKQAVCNLGKCVTDLCHSSHMKNKILVDIWEVFR